MMLKNELGASSSNFGDTLDFEQDRAGGDAQSSRVSPPDAAALLTASITLSVFSPSLAGTTACAVPRMTPQKLAIWSPSGSSCTTGIRSRSSGVHQSALLG